MSGPSIPEVTESIDQKKNASQGSGSNEEQDDTISLKDAKAIDGDIALLARAQDLTVKCESHKDERKRAVNAAYTKWMKIKELKRKVTEFRDAMIINMENQARRAGEALSQFIAGQQELERKKREMDLMRDTAAKGYARLSGWREVRERAVEISARSVRPSSASCHESLINAQRERNRSSKSLDVSRSALAVAAENLKRATQRRLIALKARAGVVAHGFANYLGRASVEERKVLDQVLDEAQREGEAKRGRPPARANDPKAEKKALRAAKERERRSCPPVKSTQMDQEEKGGPKPLIKLHDAKRHHDHLTVEDIAPIIRQHQQRMKTLEPDERIHYERRLNASRERGSQAIAKEVQDLQALGPNPQYQPLHAPEPVGDGARIIAVRGDGWQITLNDLMIGKSVLALWLSDPARRRNALKGKASRLRHAAGHLLFALPVHLHDLIRQGKMDLALAQAVDGILARLGLQGHRAAAFLHLDSKSGHPHLHIVFARVDTNKLALWNLEGRARTPALWLHGRVQTAIAFGPKSQAEDIDALAGGGEAALDGEVLMRYGNLKASLTQIDGNQVSINLQGIEAAKRLHEVGRLEHELPGGIIKFGLGPDPKAAATWAKKVSAAKEKRDFVLLAQLMADRPVNRGWWLDVKESSPAMALKSFERYLVRGSVMMDH